MMLVFKTDLGSQFKTLGSSHRQSCSIHQKSSVGRVINDIIYIIRLTILDLAVSAADPWIVEHNIAKIRSGSKHHFFFRIQGKHLSLVLSCQYINSMAHRRFRRLFFFSVVPFLVGSYLGGSDLSCSDLDCSSSDVLSSAAFTRGIAGAPVPVSVYSGRSPSNASPSSNSLVL